MRETDRVVGFRESAKMIKAGKVDYIVLARDTDRELFDELMALARGHHVRVEIVRSKEKLGQSCGIERPAAVAAYLKRIPALN